MTIEEEIEALNAEIDNIYDLYEKDVSEAYKNGLAEKSEEKKDAILSEIANKYVDIILDKEEQLIELEEKKSRGI